MRKPTANLPDSLLLILHSFNKSKEVMREREKSFRKVEIERVIWNGKVGKPTNWVRKEPAADGRGTEDRDGREEPMRPESEKATVKPILRMLT